MHKFHAVNIYTKAENLFAKFDHISHRKTYSINASGLTKRVFATHHHTSPKLYIKPESEAILYSRV